MIGLDEMCRNTSVFVEECILNYTTLLNDKMLEEIVKSTYLMTTQNDYTLLHAVQKDAAFDKWKEQNTVREVATVQD
jgi:hypothetical protein